MTVYVTFNDPPSGIYASQVIDVIRHCNHLPGTRVRLIAFISLRAFQRNRNIIRKGLPGAIVLPMFPGVGRWRLNLPLLWTALRILRPHTVVGRSVLATQLILSCRASARRIIYDGRGAICAEWQEYDVVAGQSLKNEIDSLERECVLEADVRIAVSHRLAEWWSARFGYAGNGHVIIPCTLTDLQARAAISAEQAGATRASLGIGDGDIAFLYAGSTAGWQGFGRIMDFAQQAGSDLPNSHFIFLSADHDSIRQLSEKLPGRVHRRHVPPPDVPALMQAGDYGLLLRDTSVTNRVASPVKFAEYLACGLKVLISPGIGDYSEMTVERSWGYQWPGDVKLFRPSFDEKRRISDEARAVFSKSAYDDEYRTIFQR